MSDETSSSRWRRPAPHVQQVRTGLLAIDVPEPTVDVLLPHLPMSATGVIVYGSWARGDARSASDLDILVVADRGPQRRQPVRDDRLSLSFYTEQQLAGSTGTLFGFHLARDGRVLLDRNGSLRIILASIEPPDPVQLLSKIGRLSTVLTVDPYERRHYLSGLTQVARYLLRSALYADALRSGQPCFSVGELAIRSGDPSLRDLLSSHAAEQRPVSQSTFTEVAERLEQLVGRPPRANNTLESLIVEQWNVDRELSSLAMLALGSDDSDGVPYSEVPKVVL